MWRMHLHSRDILFAAARAGRPPAKLDNVDLDAHFDQGRSDLRDRQVHRARAASQRRFFGAAAYDGGGSGAEARPQRRRIAAGGAAAVADVHQPGRAQMVRREHPGRRACLRLAESRLGRRRLRRRAGQTGPAGRQRRRPIHDARHRRRSAAGPADHHRRRRERRDHRPPFPGLRHTRGDGASAAAAGSSATDLAFAVPDTKPADAHGRRTAARISRAAPTRWRSFSPATRSSATSA